jgi:hypothetical protein
VASSRVDLGEEIRHLEGLRVERAPETAEVVADVFAEIDGFGAVAAEESGLHEALANCDDDIGRPVLLVISRGPEGFQEPLERIVSYQLQFKARQIFLPRDQHNSAARQAIR